MASRVRKEETKRKQEMEVPAVQEAIKVRIDTLNSKIRSKQDMYHLLTAYCK
jgi:hypothetical protein